MRRAIPSGRLLDERGRHVREREARKEDVGDGSHGRRSPEEGIETRSAIMTGLAPADQRERGPTEGA